MSFSDAKKLQGQMSVWVTRAWDTHYLGSMTGLSYTLGELMVTVPELSGFKTTGLCTTNN